VWHGAPGPSATTSPDLWSKGNPGTEFTSARGRPSETGSITDTV
jgi:hypothetical protein